MLLLPEPAVQKLKVFASRGFEDQGIGAEVVYGQGIIGVVAQRKKKLRLSNISRQFRLIQTMANHKLNQENIKLPGLADVESQVALPLLINDELVAVLSAESNNLNFFSHEDEVFLMTLSQLIALSIQNAQVMDQLEHKIQERTTALEQKKVELEKANASKDRLFSIIGHDLRSPAASLQNIAELIGYYSKKGDTNQLQATGAKVVKAAQNINFLLDNLLQWSISHEGDLIMQPKSLFLHELVTEVLEIYHDMAITKNIRVEVVIDKDILVLVDKNASLTIFRNLLSNALKFTHPGGKVYVRGNIQNEFAEIVIEDTGTGIESEKMMDLLEMKPHKSTKGTAKEKGTGLGLVLVKEMVRLNNGEFSLLSHGENKGTTAHLKLPLAIQ